MFSPGIVCDTHQLGDGMGSQGSLGLHRTLWPVSCRDLIVLRVDDQDLQVGASYHKPLPLVSLLLSHCLDWVALRLEDLALLLLLL